MRMDIDKRMVINSFGFLFFLFTFLYATASVHGWKIFLPLIALLWVMFMMYENVCLNDSEVLL